MTLLGLHFIRPWWLLSIIPCAILLYSLWKRHQAQQQWQHYCDPHLQQYVMQENGGKASKTWWWLLTAFLLSVVIAFTGPSWTQLPTPVYQTATARVIALDLSDSMLANDLAPSRLQRAKYKVLDLLHAIKEGQTGMLVFSSEAFVVSPLTNDTNTIASMVPTINIDTVPVQGSDTDSALIKAQQLLQQAGAEKGSIILITDSTPNAEAVNESRRLAGQGYRVFVLGVGTAQGGPIPKVNGGFLTDAKGAIQFAKLDAAALQQLASTGNGDYVAFTDNDSDVQTLVQESANTQQNEAIKSAEHNKILWQDEGHWFIWLSLIFLLLLIRRGWLEKVIA